MLNAVFTLLGFAFFAPVFFIVGFHVGKYHIRRLAINGGEERYPPQVQAIVEKYRTERRYELESLEYVQNND